MAGVFDAVAADPESVRQMYLCEASPVADEIGMIAFPYLAVWVIWGA